MNLMRAAGILLHPTSLPGEYGIGDIGPEALKFVDLMRQARQTYWQMLPLGPTGYGDSPYASFSAFAGNILLISPAKLADDRLISVDEINEGPEFDAGRVDHGAVQTWKGQILAKAFSNFRTSADEKLAKQFRLFCDEESHWLDDYALFRALKQTQNNRPWYEWPEKFKRRDERTIAIAREQLAEKISEEKFYQFLFFRQWVVLKHMRTKPESS